MQFVNTFVCYDGHKTIAVLDGKQYTRLRKVLEKTSQNVRLSIAFAVAQDVSMVKTVAGLARWSKANGVRYDVAKEVINSFVGQMFVEDTIEQHHLVNMCRVESVAQCACRKQIVTLLKYKQKADKTIENVIRNINRKDRPDGD